MLDLQLSRERPEPLYRQLADGLAYAISTGRIEAGTPLPSLREAEAAWDVNLHTVRRAYAEVEKEGLVRTVPRSGTVVLGESEREEAAAEIPATEPDAFVTRCMAEAERRFGLTGAEFARRIAALVERDPSPVWVGECSHTLGAMLAGEIRSRWLVEATPFVLNGAPPEDVAIVSTYFHYNELRRALADRPSDLSFVRIRPSPTFYGQVANALETAGTRRIGLLETDASLAHNVKADLVQWFGADLEIEIRIAGSPGGAAAEPGSTDGAAAEPASLDDGVWIVSPQNWDRLAPDARARPNVLPLRYEIESQDLERLGRERGWRARRDAVG